MQDDPIVEALRNGDEAAFISLVDRYHASIVRIATLYVHDRAIAEEIAQDTWLGVLKGIGRFEGRSALKTWIFQIMNNIARTRWERESRSLPFSALEDLDGAGAEPAIEPARFQPANHSQWPGHWSAAPQPWALSPDEHFLRQELMSCIRKAIEALPDNQRLVIELRDINGWSSEEVCNAIALSETNQRVLLHRARSRVRRAIEYYFEADKHHGIQ
jgi:RNA polymerase sigma-70 factor (ECF subfamily)